jgi:hypothetical protein
VSRGSWATRDPRPLAHFILLRQRVRRSTGSRVPLGIGFRRRRCGAEHRNQSPALCCNHGDATFCVRVVSTCDLERIERSHDRVPAVPTCARWPRGVVRPRGRGLDRAPQSGRKGVRGLEPGRRSKGSEYEVRCADASGRPGGVGSGVPDGTSDRPTCAQAGWGDLALGKEQGRWWVAVSDETRDSRTRPSFVHRACRVCVVGTRA